MELDVRSEEKGGRKEDEEVKKMKKYIWSEQDVEKYKDNLRRKEQKEERKEGEEELEELWQDLKEEIKEAKELRKKEVRKVSRRRNNWWNREVSEVKKEVRKSWKAYCKARTEVEEKRAQWIKKKKEYRSKINELKRKKREEEKRMFENIKSEKDFWKFIKKKRRGNYQPNTITNINKWKDYFLQMLEGREEKEVDLKSRETKEEEGEVIEISMEELRKVIKNLKKEKATGSDEIENEAWINATDEVLEKLRKIVNMVMKTGEMPEEWKLAIIKPLYKKGKRN